MTAARQIEHRAATWLVRREQPDWSAEDEAALQAWLNESLAHKAALWRLERGWEAADRLAALRSDRTVRLRVSLWRGPAIRALAACVALALTGTLIARSDSVVPRAVEPVGLTTQIGQHRQVRLDDGSLVTINTASALRAVVDKRQRQVWLDRGEAFFEVAHDPRHPFVILAGDRKVTVLGTRFSVRRDGETVTVSVVEGRVRLEDAQGGGKGAAAIMTAGDVAVSQGRSTLLADRSSRQIEDALSWRRGMLSFDKVTLADAAAEFNRYNRRQIRVADPKAAAIRIGGTFEATNVEAFARLLRSAFGLQVVEEEGVITVKS
jgi:transmembrane sensor